MPLQTPKNSLGFCFLIAISLAFASAQALQAQEKPYFVTYSHDLEEPGNLEIESKTTLGQPDDANRFGAMNVEFEYGVLAWWTTELYLDGQNTANESNLFTGFRLENRFRPLMREHFINPVIYVEYEGITAADKMLLEVVGHDGQADLAEPNDDTRAEQEHEAELKLILSSNVKDWNISENFIAEKNLGRALGIRLRCRDHPPVAQPCERQTMHLLPREIHRWGRTLRRPRRYRFANPERHVPLHRPHTGVATAARPSQLLSRLRPHVHQS